jgi:hypothetical protein
MTVVQSRSNEAHGARGSRARSALSTPAGGFATALAVVLASGAAAACGGRITDTAEATGSPDPRTPTPAPGSTPPPGGPRRCDASAAADIEVSSVDLNGFPPYAVYACTLVYVRRTGELVVRDLETREEMAVASAADHPRRPTASAELVAWEQDEDSHAVVRVRAMTATRGVGGLAGASAITLRGEFVRAGEPRASGASLVFTAWKGLSETDDADVWLYEASDRTSRMVLGGPGQQRFAAISPAFVAAADFNEDPDGRFDDDGKDLSDVVVYDRRTKETRVRRSAGKQAFPMLADHDVLAYLEWSGIHPEPKLVAYDIKSGPLAGDPAADRTIAHVVHASPEYARPALLGNTLEWIANPDGRTTLRRAPVDGSALPDVVAGLDGLHLYAPAPSRGFTVIATSRRSSGGGATLVPRLQAVPR